MVTSYSFVPGLWVVVGGLRLWKKGLRLWNKKFTFAGYLMFWVRFTFVIIPVYFCWKFYVCGKIGFMLWASFMFVIYVCEAYTAQMIWLLVC